jgi:hypothetical protein
LPPGRCAARGWRWAFDEREIEANLAAVAAWSSGTFEVPDVVGFADYLCSRRAFAQDLARDRRPYRPAPISFFPYPNPPKTEPRILTVADVRDVVMLRVAAGPIAARTERLLSRKVRSYRLDDEGAGAWRFQPFKKAHARLREDAVRYLKRTHCAMCKSDVAQYYPSINLGLLAESLLSWRCDRECVGFVMRVLGRWQARHGLRGIPIGPEASGVLGNAFLMPVDRALRACGVHLRWMDDLFIFRPTLDDCRDVVEPLDEALDLLSLTRSRRKTKFLTNGLAIAEVNDRLLTSLDYEMRFMKIESKELLHTAFDMYVICNEPEMNHYRWIIRALKGSSDPHGVLPLLDSLDAMNIDPKVSVDYVRHIGLGRRGVMERIMAKLEQPATDMTDGLDLRLLQAVSTRDGGRAEGRVYERIAEDEDRRPAVRAWAYQALKRTPLWRRSRAMDAALEESDPCVRRAIAVSVRGGRGPRTRRFIAHLEARAPDLRYTCRWLAAA